MYTRLLTSLVLTALGSAFAQTAVGNEPAAEAATDKAKPDTVTDAKESKELEPPPGFKIKRFGDKVVYCHKSVAVGTRFKSEKCYGEPELKVYLMERELANRNMEQTRRLSNDPSR